jgi:HEXXH motif-containing protein
MPNRHVIPQELFVSIARGAGGSPAARWLMGAQRTKQVLLLRSVVDSAAVTAHPEVAQIRQAYQRLADIQRLSGNAVEAVIRQPAIAAWAMDTIRRLLKGETGLVAGRASAITAAAAIRARTNFTGVLTADEGAVMIPSVGRALFPGARSGSEAEILVSSARTEIRACGEQVQVPDNPSHDGDGWEGLRQVALVAGHRKMQFMVDDIDPHRFAAFPGVADRLTAAEVGEWHARLQEAFQVLMARHSGVANELIEMITVLTPLAANSNGQAHATSRETFGCIALSLPQTGQSLALALAHEIQHAKLAALLDMVDFFEPASVNVLYYAPWRDDPRPLPALMHGAYAFLGVTKFWMRERKHETADRAIAAHTEFARWRAAVSEATFTISRSPGLTELGHRFLAHMNETIGACQREPVPSAAGRLARIATERHRMRWRELHGTLMSAVGRCRTPGDGPRERLPRMDDPGRDSP